MAAASSTNNDQPEEDTSELIFPKGSAILLCLVGVFLGSVQSTGTRSAISD